MPLPKEELFKALRSARYAIATQIIQAHPEDNLADAVNERGMSVFGASVCTKPPYEFIEFIINRATKSIFFSYKHKNIDETNIDSLLNLKDPRALALLINHSEIIFNQEKLSYQCQQTKVKMLNTSYKAAERKKLAPEVIEERRVNWENATIMLNMLRDATIRHAINTGDINILLKMQKAGDNLTSPLSDGTNPAFLAAHNPIIAPFFSVRPAVAVVVAKSSPVRASQSPHAVFFNGYGYANVHAHPAAEHKQDQPELEFKAPRSSAEAQARLKQLEIDRLRARAAFQNENLAQGLEFIDYAIATLKRS